MKEWLIKAVLGMLGKIVEQYITDELIEEYELKAKEYACDKFDEFAASTDWTEIDDALAAKLRKHWLG